MKKHIILLFIFTLTLSCDFVNQLESDSFYSDSFTEQLNSSDLVLIDLSDVNEDWDSLIVLGPYASINQIEEKLKLELSNIALNRISSDDSINLMVFLRDNKSVKIVEMSRSLGDFTQYETIIEKKNARFRKTNVGLEFVD